MANVEKKSLEVAGPMIEEAVDGLAFNLIKLEQGLDLHKDGLDESDARRTRDEMLTLMRRAHPIIATLSTNALALQRLTESALANERKDPET